jgi:DNA-binding GntR family transcriptional regulator
MAVINMDLLEAQNNENSMSLRARVFVTIENDILNGRYKAGESLIESRIADEMNVSRTPVREAIRQLELEGLLVYIPNKGAIVKGLSSEDIRDIFQIRIKIESIAAKRAASNITPSQLKELKEAVEFEKFYTNKGDTEQILKFDTKFHEIIFRASGSRLLDRTLTSFHHYIQRARSLSLKDMTRAKKTLSEHRAIMKAIEKGDKEKAEALMEEHVLNASENIEKLSNNIK